MKVLSALLVSVATVALAGCAAPEPKVGADGTKLASASTKCNRVVDAPLGALMKKNCGSDAQSDAKTVDKQEFLNNQQIPGTSSQR